MGGTATCSAASTSTYLTTSSATRVGGRAGGEGWVEGRGLRACRHRGPRSYHRLRPCCRRPLPPPQPLPIPIPAPVALPGIHEGAIKHVPSNQQLLRRTASYLQTIGSRTNLAALAEDSDSDSLDGVWRPWRQQRQSQAGQAPRPGSQPEAAGEAGGGELLDGGGISAELMGLLEQGSRPGLQEGRGGQPQLQPQPQPSEQQQQGEGLRVRRGAPDHHALHERASTPASRLAAVAGETGRGGRSDASDSSAGASGSAVGCGSSCSLVASPTTMADQWAQELEEQLLLSQSEEVGQSGEEEGTAGQLSGSCKEGLEAGPA